MALDDIVLYKKDLLARKSKQLSTLQGKLSLSERSLKSALNQTHSSFIFEIKPASPSKGILRAQVDATAIAKIYAPFADAISVLADEKFFKGSLENVRAVAAMQTKPVLCKDVVVSELQIYEARHYGADAVLLMLSVLDDETYASCVAVANALNLDVITEVHDEDEMARANRLGADIIGINNRNLRTLEIDLGTTKRLAPLARKDALLIAESGLSMRSQIKALHGRVDGFLIGSALMEASRIDLALRELIFGRIKICGLTNTVDAREAFAAGAYYGGINFAKSSKRRITIEDAPNIIAAAPLVWGAVFVNEPVDAVAVIAKKLGLSFVQIHGDEDEVYIDSLRARLDPSVEIWRAVRIKDSLPQSSSNADRVLLDSYSELGYGGTGKTFDWSIVRDDHRSSRYIIAGGINALNIKEIDDVRAFALDIASGVEESADPRRKSKQLLQEIFLKLRS